MKKSLNPVRLVLGADGVPVRVIVPDWMDRIQVISEMSLVDVHAASLVALGGDVLAGICAAVLGEDAERVLMSLAGTGGELRSCGCLTFGHTIVGEIETAALSLSMTDCGSVAIFHLPSATPRRRVEAAVELLAAARHKFPVDAWMEASGFGVSLFGVKGEQDRWPQADLIRLGRLDTPPGERMTTPVSGIAPPV